MTIYDAGPLAAGPLCGLLKENSYSRIIFAVKENGNRKRQSVHKSFVHDFCAH